MQTRPNENCEPDRNAGRLSQRVLWSSCGLALLVVMLALAAGFGSRNGIWSFRTGFTILTWAAYGGILTAIVAGFGLFGAVKERNFEKSCLALFVLTIGVAVCAVPLAWRTTAYRAPAIHDISTDLVHPPQFVAILPLRKDAPNPVDYGGSEVADQQRAAYPALRTMNLSAPPAETFDRALAAARVLGWQVVAAVPGEGRIEAIDTTFWFGFTDDIVIRITPAGDRSLVDIRSVSRVGKSDVGTNARRIRAFMQRLIGVRCEVGEKSTKNI